MREWMKYIFQQIILSYTYVSPNNLFFIFIKVQKKLPRCIESIGLTI